MTKEMSVADNPVGPSPTPLKTVSSRRGFATGPAGSSLKSDRPVRVEIEGLRLLSPAQIKDLLLKRKNLEEVKMLIEEEANPTFIYRGKMSLDGETFRLVDVEFRSLGPETVLRARITEVRGSGGGIWSDDVEGEVVGRIETKGGFSEEVSEGVSDAPGSMAIYRGALAGRYALRLDPSIDGGSL